MENQFQSQTTDITPEKSDAAAAAPVADAAALGTAPKTSALKAPCRADIVTAWLCLPLGFIFTHFVCEYGGGVWGGIMWAAFGAMGAAYVRLKGLNVTTGQALVFAVAGIFCTSPLFCANGFINTLSALFSLLLLLYLGAALSGAELFGRHFVLDMAIAVLARPFVGIVYAPRAALGVFKEKKAGKGLLYALLGILLALPLVFVVVPLLMFADQAFEDVLDKLIESLPTFSFVYVFEVIMAVPVGMLLCGAIFSAAEPIKPRAESGDTPAYRFIPAPIVYIAVTPVCVFYVIYIITQLRYISAFVDGTIQESYSSFAVRGFMELCVIAVINLAVIMFMQAFTVRKEGDKRSPALKGYTIAICTLTELLIISAAAKTALYIGEYGMTRLRVYASWFMALLFAVFVLITVWQIKDYKLWRAMFAAFAVMLGLLCFGNTDGFIARYNVNAYLSGSTSRIDVELLENTGISAVPSAVELYKAVENGTAELSSPYGAELGMFLKESADELERDKSFAYFSVPREAARNALNSIKESLNERSI